MNVLRVGIIGANAERGWARESHVPAVRHVAGLELAAVANKGQAAACGGRGVRRGEGLWRLLIPQIRRRIPGTQAFVFVACLSRKFEDEVLGQDLGVGVAKSPELAAAQQQGGVPAGMPFPLKLAGDGGTLRLEGGTMRGFLASRRLAKGVM